MSQSSSNVKRDGPAAVKAVISLGSNLGERERYVLSAAARIASSAGVVSARLSSLYETEPQGEGYSRPFVNAVMIIETTLAPRALLGLGAGAGEGGWKGQGRGDGRQDARYRHHPARRDAVRGTDLDDSPSAFHGEALRPRSARRARPWIPASGRMHGAAKRQGPVKRREASKGSHPGPGQAGSPCKRRY